MRDLASVALAYLAYRRRWLVLIPTLLALPVGYVVVSTSLVPEAAGEAGFHRRYSDFFQTAAQVIATLLVVIAVESKLASRAARLATREAGVVAVVWVVAAEVAAVAAVSPDLPLSWHSVLFSLTVSGGAAGLIAVILIAARREPTES
jgi:hypothetical protein